MRTYDKSFLKSLVKVAFLFPGGSREAPGMLWELSGEGLGKLCRSLFEILKGSWEIPGGLLGKVLGSYAACCWKGRKAIGGLEKLWRSLLEVSEGSLEAPVEAFGEGPVLKIIF